MSETIPTKEQLLKNFLDEIEAVSKKHGLSITYTSCDGFMVNECVVSIKDRHE